MALLFAEGFEFYGTGTVSGAGHPMSAGAWSAVNSPASIVNNAGIARTGTRYFSTSQSVDNRLAYNTNSNEVGCAVAMYFPSMPASVAQSGGIAVRDEVNETIVDVQVYPNGSIALYRMAATALGASPFAQTDSGLITASAWHHIEVRVLQDNVVGEVELRVNGVLELLVTNLNLGTVKPRFIRLSGGGSSGIARYYDDLILWDTVGDVNNTFFGPARVTTGWLLSDEIGNQWTVVGGATGAAAMTELAPDGDTSYISAAAIGAVSDFALDTLPPEAEAIAGIYVPVMAKLASAGIGDMQVSVVSGLDVASGPVRQMTAAYTYRGEVFEKDPTTGQLWTKSALEAAKLRFEKVA